MEQLGLLADATGGTVNMIEPIDLAKNFTSILANPVVATHVRYNIKSKMFFLKVKCETYCSPRNVYHRRRR